MTSPRSLGGRGGCDWSTRARRIGLSDDEQRLFDRACDADADLRVSHEVGCDFDQITQVRAGDEELIARVVDCTLASSRSGRRSHKLAWSLGAAAALVTSVAAAAWWRVAAETAHPARTLDAPAVVVMAPAAQGPAHEAQQTPPPPAEPSPPPSPTASEMIAGHSSARFAGHTARAANSARGDAVAQPDADTAAAWFRRANAARRAGELAAATSSYAKLQERFPDSQEARLSHLSLGRLLLESGRALDAERQFSSYLAGADRELAEEAWLGRAESFARLGRSGDERRTWLRLLQEFPASVYAARAKQRVDELDAQSP